MPNQSSTKQLDAVLNKSFLNETEDTIFDGNRVSLKGKYLPMARECFLPVKW